MAAALKMLLLACAWARGGTMSVRKREHYWPHKGGNLNHSGFSAFAGPFDLSKPVWTFEEPDRRLKKGGMVKVFHSSPMIDAEFNVYIQSTTGWIYSVDQHGKLRWEYQTNSTNPGNLALLDRAVYALGDDGTAFALDMDSGRVLWKRKVATKGVSDTHSLTAVGDTLLTACNIDRTSDQMSNGVCALRASDGELRWKYLMTRRSGDQYALACNQVQSVIDGKVLFSDDFGGVYCASMEDGAHMWYAKNATSLSLLKRTSGMLPYGTTATSVVGPNGLIYHPFNVAGNSGMIRAHDLASGNIVWKKTFDLEVNVAPAVGTLRTGGPLAVVVALGKNPNPVDTGSTAGPAVPARVAALDAGTGKPLWTFAPPRWTGMCAGSHPSGDGSGDLCLPDIFGTPTIGADGTVYVNFSGGYSFALRDANGDGVVDLNDPAEVSSYHHGKGTNGQTAVAPGFVVAPNCRHIAAFRA